jgi:diacylglycerol kinase (ATP)
MIPAALFYGEGKCGGIITSCPSASYIYLRGWYNAVLGLCNCMRNGVIEEVKFGIIANPKSGPSNVARKQNTLNKVAQILGPGTIVAGLDTTCREDFLRCARELGQRVDVLVVAGGDGTISELFNTLPQEIVLSYLPFGSGCALQHALGLPPQMTRIARRISQGQIHTYDLILCDGRRKAFMASVGLEGSVLNRREAIQKTGIRGPHAYALATIGSFFADMERTDMTITIDGETMIVPDAVTTIVTKIPYYGYKMKIVPNAVFDDGRLHLLALNSGWAEMVQSLASSFMEGNRAGTYRTGSRIEIATQQERYAQTDGTLYRKGRTFLFEVLPGALKIWC